MMRQTIRWTGAMLFLTLANGLSSAADLRLTAPQGGEAWCADSLHHVTWTADPLPAGTTVRIEFTSDGGQTWQVLAPAAPPTGKFFWKVPNAVSRACKIKLSAEGATTEGRSPF